MSMKDAHRALSMAVEDRLRNPTRGMPASREPVNRDWIKVAAGEYDLFEKLIPTEIVTRCAE
jgi:hypothetical protein